MLEFTVIRNYIWCPSVHFPNVEGVGALSTCKESLSAENLAKRRANLIKKTHPYMGNTYNCWDTCRNVLLIYYTRLQKGTSNKTLSLENSTKVLLTKGI